MHEVPQQNPGGRMHDPPMRRMPNREQVVIPEKSLYPSEVFSEKNRYAHKAGTVSPMSKCLGISGQIPEVPHRPLRGLKIQGKCVDGVFGFSRVDFPP